MRIFVGLLLWFLLAIGGGIWGWYETNTPGNDFQFIVTMGGVFWGGVLGCGVFVAIIRTKSRERPCDKDEPLD